MKIRYIITSVCLIFSLIACTKDSKEVTDVALNKKSLNMEVGDTERLLATILPADADNPTLLWSSDDRSIATVSNDGTVTAIGPGSTRIVAKSDDGPSDCCIVTVAEPFVPVTGIRLDKDALTLKVGDFEQLTAVITPSNAWIKTINWTSSNPDVVFVSDGGFVLGMAPGTAEVTAKTEDGALTATCKVTVEPKVTGIKLNKESLLMVEGNEDDLTVTFFPEGTSVNVEWASSNVNIVSVNDNGHLKANSPGEADITVTTADGTMTATCKVTVEPKYTGIKLDKETLTMIVGGEDDLKATITPEIGSINFTWESTNSNVVSVDSKGHLKANSAGDATIICCGAATGQSSRMAFCQVHVIDRVQSVTITASTKEINVGSTLQLKANINPSDIQGISLEWTSSDNNTATVDKDGKVTAKKKGTVTITVTVTNGPQKISATIELRVLQPVTAISVNPSSLELFEDEQIVLADKLEIKITPNDADIKTVHYGTSDYFEVKDGKLTPKKTGVGTLVIYPDNASSSNISAKCSIMINARVKSVTVDPATTTIGVNDTYQLKAVITPSTANPTVDWSSSDQSIVSVDDKGNIKGIKAGTATITATSKEDSSKKGTCKVTVEDIKVESVSLDKTTANLKLDETIKLTATVKPDNVPNKTVTWTSSDEKVATVDSNGNVKAVSVGTATITATSNADKTKSASCTVVVQPSVITVTEIVLNTSTLSMKSGDTRRITAFITPSDADNKNLIWKSSNPAVVTVSPSGSTTSATQVAEITAIDNGEATITVTSEDGGAEATCAVTVSIPVTSISLSTTSATLEFEKTLDLSSAVKINPTDATNKNLIWTSSDTSIATVSEGKVVAGSKAGTVTITVTSEDNANAKATCTITVKSKIVLVTSITITPSSATIYVGQKIHLEATVSPSNADNKNIIWAVPYDGILGVDQNGNVSAYREGTSRVTAKSEDGGASRNAVITVKTNAVASVSLSKNELVLKEGETYDLVAKVLGEDTSADASNSTVTWKTSSSSTASVAKLNSTTGRVTAVKAGTATITVTSSGDTSKTATCKVTVISGDNGSGGSEGVGFDDWNF